MAVTISDNFDSGAMASTSAVDGTTIELVPPITWTGAPNDSWGWWHFRADGVEGEAVTVEITTGSARAFGQGADRAWGWVTKDLPASATDAPDTTAWEKCSFTYGAGLTTISLPANFTDDTDAFYCATQPAYPMARLNRKFSEWQTSPYVVEAAGAPGFTVGSTTATTTLFSGRVIPALPIRCFRVDQGYIPDADRKTLLISNGNHPGESMGRWAFEGFMDWLLSADPAAERLRRMVKIIIFPHVCPSGTHGGYFRTAPDQSANDHNRQWDQGGTAPETVQLTLAGIDATTGWNIDAHLDFHALMSGQTLSELWYPAATPGPDIFAFEGRIVQTYGRIGWTDFSNAGAMIDFVRATSNNAVNLSALPDVLASDSLTSVQPIIDIGEAVGDALSRTLAPIIGRTGAAILADIAAILPADGRVWLGSEGVTHASGRVSAWLEQIDETLTAVQATADDQPYYLTNGSTIGRRPAMRYIRNGSAGPFLTFPDGIIAYGANGACTIFCCGDFSGVSANEAWFSHLTTGTQSNSRIYTRSSATRIVPMFRQAVSANQNAIDANPRHPEVLCFTNNGASSGIVGSYTAMRDGEIVTLTTEAATLTNSFSSSTSGRLPTPSMWLTGNHWAVILVAGVMDEEDRVAVSELLVEYRDTADPNLWPPDPPDPGPPSTGGSTGGSSSSFRAPPAAFIYPPEYWQRRR